MPRRAASAQISLTVENPWPLAMVWTCRSAFILGPLSATWAAFLAVARAVALLLLAPAQALLHELVDVAVHDRLDVPGLHRRPVVLDHLVRREDIGADLAAPGAVSYTHLRAHETRHDLVCRLLLEQK